MAEVLRGPSSMSAEEIEQSGAFGNHGEWVVSVVRFASEIHCTLRDEFISELKAAQAKQKQYDLLCERNDQLEQQNSRLIQDVQDLS